jgi:hypothetical protein
MFILCKKRVFHLLMSSFGSLLHAENRTEQIVRQDSDANNHL